LPTASPNDATAVTRGVAVKGSHGSDLLLGGDGDDKLNGSAGNDTLAGGQGQNTLVGSTGCDVYRLDAAQDSLDRVMKFGIKDAFDFTAASAQAHFNGGRAFTGEVGEIITTTQTLPFGARMLVLIDTDGASDADAGFAVQGSFALTEGNFVELT
jgi:Ca2+-binding RTX toxin-like protein